MTAQKHPDPRFAESIRLFNGEDYFESHEVMESLWLSVPKADVYRDLYKGVIQVAASILLRRKSVDRAAMRLAKSAWTYLEKYSSDAFEIDMNQLTKDLQAWIQSDLDIETTIRIRCLI